MWKITLILLFLIKLIAYLSVKYYYNYWKRKCIPYVDSYIFDFEWYKTPWTDYYSKIYHLLRGHKFGGCFSKFTPQLMIRDPQLIKHVLIKDFDYFQDRGDVSIDDNEPLTIHLFTAPGPLWKRKSE